MTPILTNDRDRRAWAWIVAQVGEETALRACGELDGNRRPFPSNVAKKLGLTVPTATARPSADAVQQHLDGLKSILRNKGR